ncbi:STAS domain-containing protein [Planosporangium thailandense]|uniref:Anti-sigma factor antagonist n=1 Tax=Planosporangium thailandense TaxID=765197 RepID=A0ABX0Y3M5_9ACTN|nr:STAS domain-containing protein [Planosporangium thailandense]NJC72618.1 STAS domain-containing protein [Planosporangium thailandense]
MSAAEIDFEPARLELDRVVDGEGRGRLIATGEVDISTLERLRAAIAAILTEPGLTDLVVDLEPLEFIDSAGVQALLNGKRMADDRGIAFRVANARGKVLRVLTILNLDRVLAPTTS